MATANRLIECKRTKDVLAAHLLKDCIEMCVAERFEYGAKYLLQLCGDLEVSDVLKKRAVLIAQAGLALELLKTALSIGCSVVLAPAHVDL